MTILTALTAHLETHGISYEATNGEYLPQYAQMHNHAAEIPQLIISPCSDWGVSKTLSLLHTLGIYEQMPVSVRSGGHGYFNGASCSGIMINLSNMEACSLHDTTITLQPGCILAKVIDLLQKNTKALPHGDCFDVHAGGHFTTAGWDFILSRKYGLGCQHVQRATVVLWDGRILTVDSENNRDLLWTLQGGAAAQVGVVTELTLDVFDAPPVASWCFKRLTRKPLELCVANKTFEKSQNLPPEISVSFRIHFEHGYRDPVCSFNIFSLFPVGDTLAILRQHLGAEVTDLVAARDGWSTGSILDVRMITASDYLQQNPEAIAEVTSAKLRETPLTYWEETSWKREMVDSYFTTLSDWSLPNSDTMFLELMDLWDSIKDHEMRWRMYALSTTGGPGLTSRPCAMPLGDVLTRFELHWDEAGSAEETAAKQFTEAVQQVISAYKDPRPERIYRGDIWQAEQGYDEDLEFVRMKYASRPETETETRKAS